MVCRLHRYVQKEDILRRAWELGEVDLLDLSRATLQCRALLRPVLELAKQRGFTYRWGYPLAVTFRKDATLFTLRATAELPALFEYLETDPIPDWLQILPWATAELVSLSTVTRCNHANRGTVGDPVLRGTEHVSQS